MEKENTISIWDLLNTWQNREQKSAEYYSLKLQSAIAGFHVEHKSEFDKWRMGAPIDIVKDATISPAAYSLAMPWGLSGKQLCNLKYIDLMEKAKRESERLGVAHFIGKTKQTPARVQHDGPSMTNLNMPQVVNSMTFRPADKGKDKIGYYHLFDTSTHIEGKKISDYKYKKAILDLLYPLPVELIKRRATGYYEAIIPGTGYRHIFRPCIK